MTAPPSSSVDELESAEFLRPEDAELTAEPGWSGEAEGSRSNAACLDDPDPEKADRS